MIGERDAASGEREPRTISSRSPLARLPLARPANPADLASEKLWTKRPRKRTLPELRKTRGISGVFPQRNPQAQRRGTAILSRPLQPGATFSARIHCYYYDLNRIVSKEETWS